MPARRSVKKYETYLCSACDRQWEPPADVYKTPRGWVAKFDLAGVRPEDVTVRLHDCALTVSGFRRDWALEDASGYYMMEISYNRFKRTIEMPCEVKDAHWQMEFKDGILLVKLTDKR
jgi:HSP20 family protein